jgi:UPF0755 protein
VRAPGDAEVEPTVVEQPQAAVRGPGPGRRLLRWIKGVFLVLILFGFLAGGAIAWFWHAFNAAGSLTDEKVVVIPKGIGTSGIAKVLSDAGVIDDPLVFKLGARLTVADGQLLHAGELKFPAETSVRGAIHVLVEGKAVMHRLTLAEGLTVAEIYQEIDATPELAGALPPPPTEGSLLPETYFFVLGDTRGQIVARMQGDMKAALADLWPKRDPDIALASPEDAVILASVVEKETGKEEERPRIAAVFYNRLKKSMALQSDPTVIFAITQGKSKLDHALTGPELRTDSPYNTYLMTGLPPGPIANPGIAALKAVLHPMKTKELYFVADGTGGHAFAETLEQHQKNVAKWRKFQKSQAGQDDPNDSGN